jgi:hypothetical protein
VERKLLNVENYWSRKNKNKFPKIFADDNDKEDEKRARQGREQEIVVLMSISITFYAQLFCTKVLQKVFFTYILGLIFFWQKDISANALIKCW